MNKEFVVLALLAVVLLGAGVTVACGLLGFLFYSGFAAALGAVAMFDVPEKGDSR